MQKKLNFLTELENIQHQKQYKVLLIGESCRDIYHYGNCNRLCPEAPVLIFDYERELVKPGMADNVRQNLLSFGLDVDFITNDPQKLTKKRFVDTKTNRLIFREDVGLQVNEVQIENFQNYDSIVISDYNKGLLNVSQIEKICREFSGIIFVDSKNPRLQHFKNCIIKINNYEEKKMQNFPENSELIVTMGKSGAKWKDHIFPAPEVDVFDVTGAGDVFLASLCYFTLTTNNLFLSIKNATYLASKSVQHMGVYVLTESDIREVMV